MDKIDIDRHKNTDVCLTYQNINANAQSFSLKTLKDDSHSKMLVIIVSRLLF